MDVLRLVALGLSNRDIAEELAVAPETVRWYTKQIYSKLGVSGRIQALNRARELSLRPDEGILQAGAVSPAQPPVLTPQSNLPVFITPFIGRNRELADLKRLLLKTRLLTLTGVGGTGKTRLALRVAAEMTREFSNGVYFVDLAPISDHSQVIKAIASVLGIIENAAEPQLNTIKRALADRELLLLLDNFEHVIAAAPLVSELLAEAPRLKALVTSREALHLSGEQEYPVPALSLPSDENPDTLTESEAVSLFIQRAQMLLPHFEITDENAPAIAQICARLDGLPLALELAAARVKLLSPQAMLSRLDTRLTMLTGGSRDAPLRQQTLRHTLDWSYNLLEEAEKTLFARLAVFRGGRSLEAIEAICGQGLSLDALDGLAALLDKNLVQQKEAHGGEPRFVMLETIHEYARERLAESGEAETIHQGYAAYFVELAERAEPELRGPQQIHGYQLLQLELENLRNVFEWSLGSGDMTLGVRLAGALKMFWHGYGYHMEGFQWTQRLLERLDETPETCHAKFLLCAGQMAWYHNLDMAKSIFTRALHLSRQSGDHLHAAWALMYVGYLTIEDTLKAISLAQEAAALFDNLGYKPGIAQCKNVIGEIHRFDKDDVQAKIAYEESLALAHQVGDTRLIHIVLANLSLAEHNLGNHQRAVELIRQTFPLIRERNNNYEMAGNIQIFADFIAVLGQPELAVRLFAAAAVVIKHVGAFVEPVDQEGYESMLVNLHARLDDTAFETAWKVGQAMSLDQAVTYALEASL